MRYTKGKYQIDYEKSGAALYENGKFVKCFASDETKTGLSGFDKAKKYLETLNPKR